MLAIARTVLNAGETALEALFRELYKPLLVFFAKKGCSPEEREELTQETFLRAFRSFDSFRGEAKRSSWLFAIATNLWINRIRSAEAAKRSADEVPLSEEGQAPPDPSDRPLDDALRAERLDLLRQAIDALPARMRQCVLLRVYQDMSYRDIAAALGVSVATAKSQVSLARPKLRRLLTDHYPELDADLADRGE